MCMKKPKVKTPEQKPPQYLRNPWLDGLAIGGLSGLRTGRNAMRVDLGSTNPVQNLGIPTTPSPSAPGPTSPSAPAASVAVRDYLRAVGPSLAIHALR